MRKIGMLLTMLLAAVTLAAGELKPVKYVFLFIGDGMSIPQRMLIDDYQKMRRGEPTYINRMPYNAVTTTQSASSFITDSAASGTAIACGEKTKNHRVGMDVEGTRDLVSIAKVAKESGRRVGIVTTVTLNHATPAAFYAHRPERGLAYEIGLDLIASGFDYFGGGGISKHNDTKNEAYRGDIYDLAVEAGYNVIEIPEQGRAAFDALKPGAGKVVTIGAAADLPYRIDNDDAAIPTLAEFVAKGIELLDNPKGFFLMAEGGKIDWCCHANDAATVLGEMASFDDAVRVAKAFAEKHPDETLIVVTGDHETGGLTLGFANTGYASYLYRLQAQRCSWTVFEKKVREFFEKNPKGSFDDIKPLITENIGLKFTGDENDELLLTEEETAKLREAFERQVAEIEEAKVEAAKAQAEAEKAQAEAEKAQAEAAKTQAEAEKAKAEAAKDEAAKAQAEAEKAKAKAAKPKSNAVSAAALMVLDNKAGLGWTSGSHTALPVNTTAEGVQANVFAGMIDNTDIAKILKQMVR